MSILNFPNITPDAVDMALETNTQSFVSALNGVEQTQVLPGTRWKATLTFTGRQGLEARALRAFLAALGGRAGRFYMTPFDHPLPSGVVGGTPLVKGAGQSGSALLIDGCTPNITGWLLAGDYFQIGNELKMMTADCNTNGSGETTLLFAPPLRAAVADNAAIITTNPKTVMMLVDDAQARWQVQSPVIYAMTLSCKEPIDI